MKRNVYFLSRILTLTLATVILTCHPVTASATTFKLNKTKLTIKYGKTYYKRSFGAALVPVQVYEGGKQVAGAHFFVKDGDLGCNIGQYGTYY